MHTNLVVCIFFCTFAGEYVTPVTSDNKNLGGIEIFKKSKAAMKDYVRNYH